MSGSLHCFVYNSHECSFHKHYPPDGHKGFLARCSWKALLHVDDFLLARLSSQFQPKAAWEKEKKHTEKPPPSIVKLSSPKRRKLNHLSKIKYTVLLVMYCTYSSWARRLLTDYEPLLSPFGAIIWAPHLLTLVPNLLWLCQNYVWIFFFKSSCVIFNPVSQQNF